MHRGICWASRSYAVLGAVSLVLGAGCSDADGGPNMQAAGTGAAGGLGGMGGSGGSGGSGPKVDVPPGDPVTVPPLTWKGIPVSGTLCRDGAETGFAINTNPMSDKLVIFMDGGGACFNNTTCLMNPRSWAPTDANAESSGNRGIGVRTAESNPFRDWNMVFIPYCSGDVHSGTAMSGYLGEPQMGYVNYFKALQRIIATFKNLSQVVLSGSSAGGFGSAYNWMLTQDAFGNVPVSALDDSGPPLGLEYLTACQQARVGAMWGWAGSLHPACTDCDIAGGNVVTPLIHASAKRQSTRFGLLSYDEDGTNKSFIAYGLDDCANWDAILPPSYPTGMHPMGLADLRTELTPYPHAAMYVVAGGGHTFLGGDLSAVRTGTGPTIGEWITQLVQSADGWGNVVP